MANPSYMPNVLFFIPDIGGFTRFVTETEISHSQHTIRELLELLVDSNEMGLQVAEFEGDAVLFVRTTPSSVEELLQQAQTMFGNFHAYLREREKVRVCQCGACARMHQLTLKFIAHSGPASIMDIKGHSKFIGKSVIVVHRLLKNSVPVPEYLLVTEELLDQLNRSSPLAESFERGSHRYDELGEVPYRHHALTMHPDMPSQYSQRMET